MALGILEERVPIQLEKPEGEIRLWLGPELGILLVAANGKRSSLCLEVDRKVVVAHVGEATMHPVRGETLSDYVRVLHREQWQGRTNRGAQLSRPAATRVDNMPRCNALTAFGRHAAHTTRLRAIEGGEMLSLNISNAHAFHDHRAERAC
eukprot:scaffold40252_cov28-Tisochrysis_lutea.AAC.3